MATLVRWDPIRDVTAMQNELSRLMNGLFEGNGRSTQAWVPTLDTWESDDAIVYAFDLPGVEQDKISVEAEDGALTVTAERTRSEEVSQEHFRRVERRFGTFSRTVSLPQGVSEEAITASYKDGVLEVRVPKPEQLKPRKIEIGFGSAPETIDGTATAKQATKQAA